MARPQEARAVEYPRSAAKPVLPIYVDPETGHIHSIGDAIADDVDRSSVPRPRRDGRALAPPSRRHRDALGAHAGGAPKELATWVRPGQLEPRTRQTGTVYYLQAERSRASAAGRGDDHGPQARRLRRGLLHARDRRDDPAQARLEHAIAQRETDGTNMLPGSSLAGRFRYPKSLYAVEDALRFFVGRQARRSGRSTSSRLRHDRPRRHASQQAGRRPPPVDHASRTTRCRPTSRPTLSREGLRPGDPNGRRWASASTSRSRASAQRSPARHPEASRSKATTSSLTSSRWLDGFEENVEFFDLTYEDPERVRYGPGFDAVAPLLWLRAGARGRSRSSIEARRSEVTDAYGDPLRPRRLRPSLTPSGRRRRADRVHRHRRRDPVPGRRRAATRHVEPVRLYAAYLDNFGIAAEGLECGSR